MIVIPVWPVGGNATVPVRAVGTVRSRATPAVDLQYNSPGSQDSPSKRSQSRGKLHAGLDGGVMTALRARVNWNSSVSISWNHLKSMAKLACGKPFEDSHKQPAGHSKVRRPMINLLLAILVFQRWRRHQYGGAYDIGEEGAEETYLDNEIPIVAAPLDLDELTSFNTTILPSYPNSPINEPEFHLDPNHVENQSQVGIPSDLVFDCESTVDELADCQDGFETVTGLELYDSHRPFAAASKDIRTLSYHFLQTIPPRPLYTGQFEWLEPIFERYNNEFCLIPLTLDMPANPFRSRMNALQKSGYLLHAVLALACHHTDHSSLSSSGRHQLSETVLNHGQIALQLFRQALNNDNVNQIAASLLDTIITLFSLDEAYSLLGSWTTHLTGAYNVVQLSGGVEAWTRNPRAAVQVALLTWWDAVLSLVNRTPCIFPYEYFESVLACADDRFFTYFGLCGCPRSLVVPLVQLAHLAEEKQKSSSMRWVSFDDSLVLEIEQSLETWSHNPSDTAFDDEENVHKDMDQIHCSEAWRNGLLLYIYRVFRWKPGDRTPGRVIHRARTILDHACACRDDQFVARQALLPLFFAGCEMHDPDARNTIRELCSAWHDRTGYYMFGGMIPLLEEVWTAQATHGPEQVWWGQVVDEKSRKESQNSLQVRICFG
ncbi:Fungal specific transcription factor domain-containing protein [Cladophialophora immunda]|nr:Fungal specific transcription factor domain-containing protein [Cladophialophora immunda]